MSSAMLDQIVNAVLYEGYLLYPYRASSPKNQRERFTFGRVYPRAYSLAQNGAEPALIQTECLFQNSSPSGRAEPATLQISVRFLQPMWREAGALAMPLTEWPLDHEPAFQIVPELKINDTHYPTWQEAIERKVSSPKISAETEAAEKVRFEFPASRSIEPLRDEQNRIAGVLLRRTEAITGVMEHEVSTLARGLRKITVRVKNQSLLPDSDLGKADRVMGRTFASTHTILRAEGAEFLSLMDPPLECKEQAAQCKNIGTWPVLVGDQEKAERDTMLSSPIILYDYPRIAPESRGDLFDGTEIDELLTLRIMTMSEEEKREMRHVDVRARQLLERTETLPKEDLLSMHGALRGFRSFDEQLFGSSSPLESVSWKNVSLTRGSRVRIRPRSRADVIDIALAGRTAIVEAVEQDAEQRVHLALVLEDDPGRDLGMMRQAGHRFFYRLDEVEPLQEAAQ